MNIDTVITVYFILCLFIVGVAMGLYDANKIDKEMKGRIILSAFFFPIALPIIFIAFIIKFIIEKNEDSSRN